MVKVQGGKSSKRSVNLSKAIIFAFLAIYLIIYGIGMTVFIENYDQPLPLYFTYLPLMFFVGATFVSFGLLIFIKNTRSPKARQTKSRKKKKVKAGSVYKQALLVTIFIFSLVPLLAPIIDQGKNDQNFSVYNTDNWNGCSDFKLLLEDKGYTCYSVQSSLSTTERINESQSVVLVILGANQYYNPINEIPYFMKFLEDGNSLLLCHDHGSTENLLYEIFTANMMNPDIQDQMPITIFPNGILRDTANYDKNPEFPVIKTFDPTHDITDGISEVILSKSSCAVGGPLLELSGWETLGFSSMSSFVDRNDDDKYDPDDDYIDLSFLTEIDVIDDALEDFPDDLMEKFPLGVYPQSVFMAKETDDARIVVSADASLFNNELIDMDGYDNKQLALNMINWLTRNEDKDDWIIVFDEAHIRPEKSRDMTSAGIYGFIIQYIVHLSTNPITAWIYPLLAIYTLKKYLPKPDKKKEEERKAKEEAKKEEKLKFRTSSFFAKKIEWYRNKSKYGKPLTLLYRRLERKLNALLGGQKITTRNVIEMVVAKEPRITRTKIRRITRFMDKILVIKAGKRKVRNERDFENIFFEMEWVANNI